VVRLLADVGQPTDEPQDHVVLACLSLHVEFFEIKSIIINLVFEKTKQEELS